MKKKVNQLIVIENGQLQVYNLDDRAEWTLGRPSKDNMPDIKMYSLTVSRKQGLLQNSDGFWYYMDCHGKNGTAYNGKVLKKDLRGHSSFKMLNHGDTFVFGGGEEGLLTHKTVWARYMTFSFGEDWCVVDTKGDNHIALVGNEAERELIRPEKGTVLETEEGMAIYMGDLTYVIGEAKLKHDK